MKRSPRKNAIAGSVLALVLVAGTSAGGIAIANAASTQQGTSNSTDLPEANDTPDVQGEADTPEANDTADGPSSTEGNDQSVKGSITVPESSTELSAADESAQLAKLATIDQAAASAAAISAVPGSVVDSTVLGEEDGSLIYEVLLTDGAGSKTEVKIDAGTAKALSVGPAEANAGEQTETQDNG